MAFLAVVVPGRAQRFDQPQWLKLRITGGSLNFDAEAEQQTTAQPGGAEFTSRRLYLSPTIGLEGAGSIYHPELFQFNFGAEPGYTWQQSSTTPGSTLTQDSVIQNYHFNGKFLELKPYMTTAFISQTHGFSEYDFFNSAVVDVQTYGVSTGWREGPVPVLFDFRDTHQDSQGFSQRIINDQRTLDLRAHNDRAGANYTDFDYRYGEFDNTTGTSLSSSSYSTANHYLNLSDVEHFGGQRQNSLFSRLNFNEVDSVFNSSRNFNGSSLLHLQHTSSLGSDYGYAFSWYDNDFTETEQHALRASLTHQLYESLSSSIGVRGQFYDQSSADDSKLDSQSGGVTGSEAYSKRLGSWGHLFLSANASYDLWDQTSSGASVLIANEPQQLVSGIPKALNQPRVQSIVSVTDTNNLPLREGLDYSVNRSLDPWTIELITSSPNIRSGDTVLVTYDVAPNPTGGYSTLYDQFLARLDFFHGLLSIYGSIGFVENFTNAPGFVLEDYTETQAGGSFDWRGLHLAANYYIRDSSLNSYTSKSLIESYSHPAFSGSTISLNLAQSWIDYPDLHEQTSYYSFIGRFFWQPTPHLTWDVEGGLESNRGNGLDQDRATARTHLDWRMGKLSWRIFYEYGDQLINGETRTRHLIQLSFRRVF